MRRNPVYGFPYGQKNKKTFLPSTAALACICKNSSAISVISQGVASKENIHFIYKQNLFSLLVLGMKGQGLLTFSNSPTLLSSGRTLVLPLWNCSFVPCNSHSSSATLSDLILGNEATERMCPFASSGTARAAACCCMRAKISSGCWGAQDLIHGVDPFHFQFFRAEPLKLDSFDLELFVHPTHAGHLAVTAPWGNAPLFVHQLCTLSLRLLDEDLVENAGWPEWIIPSVCSPKFLSGYSIQFHPWGPCNIKTPNHVFFIDETEGINNDLAAAWLLLEMMMNYNMMRGVKASSKSWGKSTIEPVQQKQGDMDDFFHLISTMGGKKAETTRTYLARMGPCLPYCMSGNVAI